MCWLIIFLLNPLFYDRANSELSSPGLLHNAQVVTLLTQWTEAQWVRTVVSVTGLIAAVVGLVAGRRSVTNELLSARCPRRIP